MKHTCPKCSGDARRSHRKPWERLLGLAFVLPYRCVDCDARFYRFSTTGHQKVDASSEPKLQ